MSMRICAKSTVLTPGGKLILTTPNGAFRLLPFQKPWNPYHLRGSAPGSSAVAYRIFLALSMSLASPGVTPFWRWKRARVRQSPTRVYGIMLAQWLEQKLGISLSRLRGHPRKRSRTDARRRWRDHTQCFFLSTTPETAMDLLRWRIAALTLSGLADLTGVVPPQAIEHTLLCLRH